MIKIKFPKKVKKYIIASKIRIDRAMLNEVASNFERFLDSDDKVFSIDGTIFEIKEI